MVPVNCVWAECTEIRFFSPKLQLSGLQLPNRSLGVIGQEPATASTVSVSLYVALKVETH